jgi:hypothetical protein
MAMLSGKKQVTSIVTIVFAVVYGMCLSGCGLIFAVGATIAANQPRTTEIPHPMEAGKIHHNHIQYTNEGTERQLSLQEGTLTHSSSLTELTEEKICFSVNVREAVWDNAAPKSSDLSVWQVSFESSGEEQAYQVDKLNLNTDMQRHQGSIPRRVQTGTETVCTQKDQYDICQRWMTRPVYGINYYPGTILVYSGIGDICVTNHGVNETTEYVRLDLGRQGERTLRFRWDFLKKEVESTS